MRCTHMRDLDLVVITLINPFSFQLKTTEGKSLSSVHKSKSKFPMVLVQYNPDNVADQALESSTRRTVRVLLPASAAMSSGNIWSPKIWWGFANVLDFHCIID
jgi:hypothetical protein